MDEFKRLYRTAGIFAKEKNYFVAANIYKYLYEKIERTENNQELQQLMTECALRCAHYRRLSFKYEFQGQTTAEYSGEITKFFKIASDRGECLGTIGYGYALKDGDGIERDTEEAMRYFKIAADSGAPEAMHVYALENEKIGKEENLRIAAEYYQKAIETGNYTRSKNNYAKMLQDGKGVEKDPVMAAKLFKEAADFGHPESIFIYAGKLLEGDGVEKNIQEAAMYYKKSADLGEPISMYNYACIKQEIGGLENYRIAVEYYEKAIKNNFLKAKYNLGIMYEYGLSVERDEKKAMRLYREAAEAGCEIAAVRYARKLTEDEKIFRNYEEAIRYCNMFEEYRPAAELERYIRMTLFSKRIEQEQNSVPCSIA